MPLPDSLLLSLARDFGSPLYVYDQSLMESQYTKLSDALKGLDASICYAVKANSNLAILKVFSHLSSGFDVVSEGEIRKVIVSGGDPTKIIYSGVGKGSEEIEFALSQRIRMLNAESLPELQKVAAVAASLGICANVALRVNPDICVDTHPHLTTGIKTSKFGIAEEDIATAWDFIKSSSVLELKGLACHIGSQISDITPYEEAFNKLLNIAELLRKEGAPIDTLDFGGGLGVSFSGHYEPLDLSELSRVVKKTFAGRDYKLVFEPGKYLVSESGTLITKVQYVKNNGPHKFVVVDAGMNDLVRPAMYDAFHHLDVLSESSLPSERATVDVVGPVCESACYFARARELPLPTEGDCIAIRDAGAYGFSMASNYNGRRLPAEVLVAPDSSFRLIRKRESFEELWRNESLS